MTAQRLCWCVVPTANGALSLAKRQLTERAKLFEHVWRRSRRIHFPVQVRAYTKKPGSGPSSETPRAADGSAAPLTSAISKLTSTLVGDFSSLLGRAE